VIPRAGRIALTIAALVIVGAPGCDAPGGSGIEPGERVTVYVSMPLRGPEGVEGREVARAARLALADARHRAGELRVQAVYYDDTSGSGARARWSQAVAAANAREAAQDSSAIAYVGDLASGATRASLPITNEARMLQVSPASAAIDLVQPFLGAGDQLPEQVQATGERTFGRVIPSDEVQARAAAEWVKRLGARRLGTISDGSEFGRTMVRAFRQSLPPAWFERGAPDLLYYGGGPERMPGSLRSFSGPVMASDALLQDAPSEPGLLATSAAQATSQLPRAGQRFVRAFTRRYGDAPGPYAAYGYEAMAVVLDSIRRAGDQGDSRDAVVESFFDTRDRDSVLGTYSIDEVGNTTLGRLAGYRIVEGRPRLQAALLVP
jgi:branched-chain amino acid transport system substrate-binding protein